MSPPSHSKMSPYSPVVTGSAVPIRWRATWARPQSRISLMGGGQRIWRDTGQAVDNTHGIADMHVRVKLHHDPRVPIIAGGSGIAHASLRLSTLLGLGKACGACSPGMNLHGSQQSAILVAKAAAIGATSERLTRQHLRYASGRPGQHRINTAAPGAKCSVRRLSMCSMASRKTRHKGPRHPSPTSTRSAIACKPLNVTRKEKRITSNEVAGTSTQTWAIPTPKR